MTWPEGVETCQIVFGKGISPDGKSVAATIEVRALFAGSTTSIVWDGDGTAMLPIVAKGEAEAGQFGSVSVPVVDQDGWLTDNQESFSMWGYQVIEVAGNVPRTKYVQPLSGQGTIDFDRIPDGSIGLPGSGPVVAVSAVNEKTGNVTLSASDVGARPVDWVPTAEDLEPVLEDTFVRRLSVGSRFAVIGDSMEAGDTSWVYYLCALSGGRASLAVKAGVSGNTTTQMLARLQADVIDRNPDVCIVGGATNDHMTGVPQATTLANVQAMVAMLRDAGITAGVRLTPPTNAAGAGPWNTIQLRRDQIRRWNLLLSSWATSEGVFVLDFYTPLVDPATGGFKSGLNSDADHPNEQGFHDAAAFMIAQGLPAAFAFNPAMLSTTLSDPNSLWEPTFGSNGVFVDDTNGDQLANGWNGGGGGTGTRTLVAADPPAVGNWQGYTNPSADWTAYQDSITPPYAAGDVLALSGRFRTTGGGRFRARLTPNNGNASLDFGPLGLPIDDGYFYVELKTTGTGATRARSNLQALIATGTVEFAQVQFVNLTALGII